MFEKSLMFNQKLLFGCLSTGLCLECIELQLFLIYLSLQCLKMVVFSERCWRVSAVCLKNTIQPHHANTS